jgi:hypothetical protein
MNDGRKRMWDTVKPNLLTDFNFTIFRDAEATAWDHNCVYAARQYGREKIIIFNNNVVKMEIVRETV